jgi:hypothetical protein
VLLFLLVADECKHEAHVTWCTLQLEGSDPVAAVTAYNAMKAETVSHGQWLDKEKQEQLVSVGRFVSWVTRLCAVSSSPITS